jgi:hypothetical protein
MRYCRSEPLARQVTAVMQWSPAALEPMERIIEDGRVEAHRGAA